MKHKKLFIPPALPHIKCRHPNCCQPCQQNCQMCQGMGGNDTSSFVMLKPCCQRCRNSHMGSGMRDYRLRQLIRGPSEVLLKHPGLDRGSSSPRAARSKHPLRRRGPARRGSAIWRGSGRARRRAAVRFLPLHTGHATSPQTTTSSKLNA